MWSSNFYNQREVREGDDDSRERMEEIKNSFAGLEKMFSGCQKKSLADLP